VIWRRAALRSRTGEGKRKAMWRLTAAACLLLMVGAALPAAARPDAALGAIDACVMRLDAEIDEGFARVAARCPQLSSDLRSSNWAAWLPRGWDSPHNTLSAKSLAALHQLVARELSLTRSARTPDVARLRPILAQLAGAQQERRGFWARLQAWLRRMLAPRAAADPESTFVRFFGRLSLSQAALEFISYATVVFVVGLAAFIVLNEWRASGGRTRRRKLESAGMSANRDNARLMNWQDLEGAAAAERPRLLLELLAARLTAARRLPVAAALTVRELTRAAELADAEDRARLSEVALESERLRYSAHLTAPSGLTAVMVRGRELLERLDASYLASA